jgi:hypothetical protein
MVVEDVLSSPDRIQGIQGFAGSGKTTTLSVIRGAAESQGFMSRDLPRLPVLRGSLAWPVSRQVLCKDFSPGRFPRCRQTTSISISWTNRTWRPPTRCASFSPVLLRRTGVWLIGDTRQHQGVEAGRPFEQLQEAGMRTVKLDQIVRQKVPELKSAVEMLATGQVSDAMDSLKKQGRVKEISDHEERIRAIAKSYAESPERTLIVSPDNASRRDLNIAVRQKMKANGTIDSEDHHLQILVQRQDMTGAERSWASHYEINDVVRYSRGSRSTGIEAGCVFGRGA